MLHRLGSAAFVGSERERFFSHGILPLLGLDVSPNITVGSRLEEAVRDNRELESLCQACESLPFLLSVRVSELIIGGTCGCT